MQATEAAQQGNRSSAGRGGTPGKVAVTAFVLAAAVIVYGAYGDPHHKSNQESAVPFLLIVTAVVAAAMFGWYVPKGLRALREERTHAARWAVVPGIVALVLSPAAFWSGIPLILGAGAALLGWQTREQRLAAGSPTRPGTAAVVMGVIVVAGTIVVTVLGNVLGGS